MPGRGQWRPAVAARPIVVWSDVDHIRPGAPVPMPLRRAGVFAGVAGVEHAARRPHSRRRSSVERGRSPGRRSQRDVPGVECRYGVRCRNRWCHQVRCALVVDGGGQPGGAKRCFSPRRSHQARPSSCLVRRTNSFRDESH